MQKKNYKNFRYKNFVKNFRLRKKILKIAFLIVEQLYYS